MPQINGVCKVKRKLFRLYNKDYNLSMYLFFNFCRISTSLYTRSIWRRSWIFPNHCRWVLLKLVINFKLHILNLFLNVNFLTFILRMFLLNQMALVQTIITIVLDMLLRLKSIVKTISGWKRIAKSHANYVKVHISISSCFFTFFEMDFSKNYSYSRLSNNSLSNKCSLWKISRT